LALLHDNFLCGCWPARILAASGRQQLEPWHILGSTFNASNTYISRDAPTFLLNHCPEGFPLENNVNPQQISVYRGFSFSDLAAIEVGTVINFGPLCKVTRLQAFCCDCYSHLIS